MQEKTSEPFPPTRIGGIIGLSKWVDVQRQRKNGVKGKPALSKAEEDEVD